MRKKLLFFSTLLLLFSCGGSKDEPKPAAEDRINIVEGNSGTTFSGAGEQYKVKFFSSGDWTASSDASWLGISQNTGGKGTTTITVTALSDNDTSEPLSTTLQIRSGNASASVSFKLKGKDVPPETKPFSGLPARWNFYALGYVNFTKELALGTSYAKNWTFESADKYITATEGNSGARVMPVAKKGKVNNVTLNPSIQVQGLLEGDWIQFVIPVTGFKSGTEIRVSGATGSAGSSVGYWLMEYSSDGNTWFEAPGATEQPGNGHSVKAHFWNTTTSITSYTRTCYYGEKGDTYHCYTFSCDKISDIEDGNLYIRLRALKYNCMNGNEVSAGWTDIKHFLVERASDTPVKDPEPHLYKIIAHRGGYRENGLTQCSVQSLKETIRERCYGSECDIMWTADGDVLVCHPDENGKVNGLIPSVSTMAQIRSAGKLDNGEQMPSLEDFLKVVSDPEINPLGTKLWLDVKWVNADLTEKVMYAAAEIAKKMNACQYIEFLTPGAYKKYVDMSVYMMDNYGIPSAWNGKVTTPSSYGKYGWGQMPWTTLLSSSYWPPDQYFNAGVQVSIYSTPTNYTGGGAYEDSGFLRDALPLYDKCKALFVNHPQYIISHLILSGKEKL